MKHFLAYHQQIGVKHMKLIHFRCGAAILVGLLAAVLFAGLAPLPALAAERNAASQAEQEPAPVEPAGRSIYAGATRGVALPMTMHEQWNNAALGQSADLWEEMDRGNLTGSMAGFAPAILSARLAVELEQNEESADVRTIMSPGFKAGKYTVAAFDAEAADSRIAFHSTFLNLLLRHASGRVHPYIGIGPGVTRSAIAFNEPALTNEGLGFVESGETTRYSYQLLAGIDFSVTERVTIGLGYKFFAVNPTFEWANGSHSAYDPRTHSLVLNLKFN